MANFPGSRGDFLRDEIRYREWRKTRLQTCPKSADHIRVKIDGLLAMTAAQKVAIHSTCKQANMVIYQCRDPFVDRAAIVVFASQFGLTRIDHHLCANADGVSELSVASEGIRTGYVPYSSRSLSWHTDGYYNGKKDRSMPLSCTAHSRRRPVVRTRCWTRTLLTYVCVMRTRASSRLLSTPGV